MYEKIFTQIRHEAEKRNLRDSTINAYCNSVRYFLNTVNKEISDLTTDDVDAFLAAKRLSGLSPETYNHYYSSIRFFYKRVLKMNWDDDIPRDDRTIHVRESKSRRDRYTILSDRNLDILTEYWFKCGRPRDILFPSSWTGTYLSNNSINQFFKKSAAAAGITKKVSSHCCRHSFASHLFENGVDIKYIQALLGHVDPKSTEIYIHVSNKSLLGIRSPFDQPKGGAV